MAEQPRVAIAHDYLTQRGGAERVVLALVKALPEATLYTTLYEPESTYPEFEDVNIVCSPLNRSRFLRRHHRAGLPLYAWASNRLQIDADVTVASTSGWAHSFEITGRRIVYCHTPARFLYLSDEYLGRPAWQTLPGLALSALKPALIQRDRGAAEKADHYFANSRVVAERIKQCYSIDAELLPAPISINPHASSSPVRDLLDWQQAGYFLVVSRLLPYKNVDKAIAAVGRTGDRLVVVGTGPEYARLSQQLSPHVRLIAGLSDAQLRWVYRHATALIAPSYEDYGLTPLEAAAFGKPTVALRAGGYLDTVISDQTGVFFEKPEPGNIADALMKLKSSRLKTTVISQHAERFTEEHFIQRLRECVAGVTSR
jgi:glycosyltransferase involved in cell wall biosynthesis